MFAKISAFSIVGFASLSLALFTPFVDLSEKNTIMESAVHTFNDSGWQSDESGRQSDDSGWQ